MMRRALLALLFASPAVWAADGSWTSQSFGGTLTRGQQSLKSRMVQAPSPLPVGSVATRLAWKITPDGPTPVGFSIKICSSSRCLPLTGLTGDLALPAGYPPAGPYRFEYYSPVRGALYPPLTMLRNEVTVQYRSGAR
ncbi:flagellar protein FlhE [Enterobacter asburiae]|uniref:flagellar protein FlhE n=1 Tax=Scandinavium sp. UTDF21-P1B TaxID=3446379 RepID=UPI00348BB3D8